VREETGLTVQGELRLALSVEVGDVGVIAHTYRVRSDRHDPAERSRRLRSSCRVDLWIAGQRADPCEHHPPSVACWSTAAYASSQSASRRTVRLAVSGECLPTYSTRTAKRWPNGQAGAAGSGYRASPTGSSRRGNGGGPRKSTIESAVVRSASSRLPKAPTRHPPMGRSDPSRGAHQDRRTEGVFSSTTADARPTTSPEE
jgi:hypothetical protein